MKTIEETYRARLRLLIAEYGSQAALARAIDKAPAQISQWVNGSPSSITGPPRSLKSETAREIEEKLNKPKGWFDQPITSEKTETAPAAKPLEDSIVFQHRDISVSCGNGIINADFPEIIRTLEIPKSKIFELFGRNNINNLDIVSIKGDSMEPTIPQKAVAFVDSTIIRYDGDGIYAFYYSDAVYIKRLQKVPGKLIAHSDNRIYDPFEILPANADEFHIIGKFVGVLPLNILEL